MRLAALLLLTAALAASAASKPEFKAGVATLDITPSGPIWMSGYAARTKPSEGVDMPLWAKAIAIQDAKGKRAVIVTTDLIGLPREITDPICARLGKAFNLRRAEILFNSSHTHAGPAVWPNLRPMFELAADHRKAVDDYAAKLTNDLYTVASAALGKLEPASLRYGEGTAGFAINRREFAKGTVGFGANPKGPIDHKVPVVEFRRADGSRLAILFGYTCHNTTLVGNNYRISGDYAGAAQREVETKYPGTIALFLLLCGGDQNPNPRGQPEHVPEYGRQLAAGVTQALDGKLETIRAPLRTAFQHVDLAFAPHTREQFEEEAKHTDVFRARRARMMLAKYDAGQPPRKLAYPVQAIRFHKDLTILALGGEVVVDYQLRAKRQYPAERLIVAGYSNDVMSYIPSLRVLREGGYEAESSMIYYGQPGKYSEDVEETIFTAIQRVLKQTGVK